MTNISEIKPVVISDNHTTFLAKRTCGCQEEVATTGNQEKIEELLQAEDGMLTTAQVTEAGLHRSVIKKLVDDGQIYRYSRGLYVREDAWEDDFYVLQSRYPRGIFSHDTALFLLGYSNRPPFKYEMTFPKGYNAPSIKEQPFLIARHAKPGIYELGVTEVKTPYGNTVRVYDKERSLCDAVRGRGSDAQIINDAMKQYAWSKGKDIYKLHEYAKQLHVLPKVSRYMEVLL